MLLTVRLYSGRVWIFEFGMSTACVVSSLTEANMLYVTSDCYSLGGWLGYYYLVVHLSVCVHSSCEICSFAPFIWVLSGYFTYLDTSTRPDELWYLEHPYITLPFILHQIQHSNPTSLKINILWMLKNRP